MQQKLVKVVALLVIGFGILWYWNYSVSKVASLQNSETYGLQENEAPSEKFVRGDENNLQAYSSYIMDIELKGIGTYDTPDQGKKKLSTSVEGQLEVFLRSRESAAERFDSATLKKHVGYFRFAAVSARVANIAKASNVDEKKQKEKGSARIISTEELTGRFIALKPGQEREYLEQQKKPQFFMSGPQLNDENVLGVARFIVHNMPRKLFEGEVGATESINTDGEIHRSGSEEQAKGSVSFSSSSSSVASFSKMNSARTSSFERSDMYGTVRLRWDHKEFPGGQVWRAVFTSEDSKDSISKWQRDLTWTIREGKSPDAPNEEKRVLFSASGRENVVLFIGGTSVSQIVNSFEYEAKKHGQRISLDSLERQIGSLNSYAMVPAGHRSGKLRAVSSMSLAELKSVLYGQGGSPAFYRKIVTFLDSGNLSTEEALKLLNSLDLDSNGYRNLVRALSLSRGEFKEVITDHMETVSEVQKLKLFPLLAQGRETTPEVLSYLENTAGSKDQPKGAKDVAALTIGSSSYFMEQGKLEGGVDPSRLQRLMTKSLTEAKDSDEKRRWLSALGNSGISSVTELATPFMNDQDPVVREKAYFALRNVTDPSKFETVSKNLLLGLKDSHPGVRSRAAKAVAHFVRYSAAGSLSEEQKERFRQAAADHSDVAVKRAVKKAFKF